MTGGGVSCAKNTLPPPKKGIPAPGWGKRKASDLKKSGNIFLKSQNPFKENFIKILISYKTQILCFIQSLGNDISSKKNTFIRC